jgi:hypothetical protein
MYTRVKKHEGTAHNTHETYSQLIVHCKSMPKAKDNEDEEEDPMDSCKNENNEVCNSPVEAAGSCCDLSKEKCRGAAVTDTSLTDALVRVGEVKVTEDLKGSDMICYCSAAA